MPEPSTHKSESKTVTIALIGAGATIVAALIGLAPILLGRHPGGDPAPVLSAGAGATKDVRPAPSGEASVPRVAAVSSPARPAGKFAFGKPKVAAPQPPITVSYRKSKVLGQGLVLGLTNTSEKETLKTAVVYVKSANGSERSYRVARSIRPNDSISLGWKELDGWKLGPGDQVRIKVDRYAAPVESVIPPG